MDKHLQRAALLVGRLVKAAPTVQRKADDDQVRHISEVKRQAEKFRKFFKEGYAGKTGTRKADVDPKQLAMGIKVEAEHCEDMDTRIKIVLDHLTEDPLYYTHLDEMEQKYGGKKK